ncbi:putative bifunctional diguanylate cyclase/phosphodiesterase [Porphyrobacter sp. CACIAM 03H1]|uniref:putative bifunctional diguanylate cyclase/phosphodiesterase n=1 Tax=Porphyrobacter sp. CACIAM 03H1 TaxID=2003315 RepID=UPI0015606A38|nr:EAL domain-containing protein [Porphyrobacter sp. CACIAM 03H1]
MWVHGLLFPAQSSSEQLEQIREIFDNLRKQIPLLYAAAIVNLIGMHVAIGGAELKLISPITVLSAVLLWRAFFWAFVQKPTEDLLKARTELLQVAAFTVLLCTGFSIWAQFLITAYPELALSVVFFSLLAALGAAYGLSSFPRAAVVPLTLLGMPVAVRLLFLGDGLTKAMGFSLLLVILLFMRLLQTHSKALTDLISSRMAAAREHNRAISAEVAAIKRADADDLTGVANRAKLIRDIGRDMIQGPATGGGSVVAICDLDGFKRANDVFGHAAGDALLIAFGQRLAEEFSGAATVARMGGDEFAVFWRDGLSTAELFAAGDRICELAAQPVEWNGKKLTVGTSCGITEAGPYANSVQEFLRQADTALYMAKASGRGRWQFYDEIAFSIDKRRAKLELLLLSEEAFSELYVDFQPIYEVSSGNLVYLEALARWHSMQLGSVSPGEFISLAENLGKIEAINEAILEKALTNACGWPPGVRLSFNLSAAQISRGGTAERILATLAKHRVSPNLMLFEVTESAVLADMRTAKQELEILRHAGCLVALDDFGAGHASVAYLRHLVFDVVKLDGSLTKDIETCTRSRQVLLGLVNLCHAAGALCVAEHIETAGQLDLVRTMGCDLAQGFHLSRPIEPDHIEGLWRRQSLSR